MSSQPSSVLASLTATYTDSEGEEDVNDEEENEQTPSHEDGSVNSNNSPPTGSVIAAQPTPVSAPTVAVATIAQGVARLVSYHDDTLISDEEGVDGERRRSMDDPEDVQLPPEPFGRCSNELQEKITRLYEKMQSSVLDMNHVIQQRKDFRNPSIYEKLIQFCSINELGTNYPINIYDPLRWGKESYYEELAKVQKAEMDRREKERKDRTKVEVVTGTAKRPGSGSGAEDDAKKRISKWDQVGTTGTGQTQPGVLKPAGLVHQPSLTASATGTKGTVISAFGSLPKKPRL